MFVFGVLIVCDWFGIVWFGPATLGLWHWFVCYLV